jgi:hypothetical protein
VSRSVAQCRAGSLGHVLRVLSGTLVRDTEIVEVFRVACRFSRVLSDTLVRDTEIFEVFRVAGHSLVFYRALWCATLKSSRFLESRALSLVFYRAFWGATLKSSSVLGSRGHFPRVLSGWRACDTVFLRF